MSLMGCMAVSAGLFFPHRDVTFLQVQISNLCLEALLLSSSLPPAPRQIMTEKCTGFQAIISLNENKKFF